MMMVVMKVKYFIDLLIEKINKKNSHICVGLDPHPELIPPYLISKAERAGEKSSALSFAVLEFNKKIIDNIYDLTAVVKPQIAFYELMGAEGIKVLEQTIAYAHKKGLIVLLDAKRNDIGSTVNAYYNAYMRGENSVDAITINPYLGSDSILPFLINEEKGAFSLIKTSNPGADEIQDLELKNGKKLFQEIGQFISQQGKKYSGKNNYSNLGAVVGATYPEELKLLRQEMKETYFLIPGFGVQGGKVEDIKYAFNKDGYGAIINSSRGILFAYHYEGIDEKEYAITARKAAMKMRDDINKIIKIR